MLTAALPSNGTMTRRLHLRHFSSTPSSTTRASKLPQQQRKDVDGFDASSVLARLD